MTLNSDANLTKPYGFKSWFSSCVGKSFKFMMFTFLKKALNLGIFTHALLPSQNSRQNFMKICFPQQQKGVEKTRICFIQSQSEKRI